MVTKWSIPDITKPFRALATNTVHTIPLIQLFPHPTAIRVSLRKKLGVLYSVLDTRIQCRPFWPTIAADDEPYWIRWMHSGVASLPTSYCPRLFTDGAYDDSATISAVFRPTTTIRHSSASVILKDCTDQWKRKPVLILHISNGAGINAPSAYTMEYIALAAAMKLQSRGITNTPIGSDAASIITALPQRRHKLRQITKDHIIPLQCIDDSLHIGCPTPVHVESHPERRKPGNRANWDNDDWGNFIADRAAAADYETLRDAGIQLQVLEMSATTIYNDLLSPLQWYIGYKNGDPVLPNGPLAHIHDTRFLEYLKDRDVDRSKRQEPAYWHDNSLLYCAKIFSMQKASVASVASKCRLIYDKHWHGRNRQKDDTLTEPERVEIGKCILCRDQDSQTHAFHYCSDKTLSTLRSEILTNLNKHIHTYDSESTLQRQIGRAYLEVLNTTPEPGRLWTGNLSSAQINQLTTLVNPTLLTGITQAQLNHLFTPVSRILADGCMSLNHHKLITEKQHALATQQPERRSKQKKTSRTNHSSEEPKTKQQHKPNRNPSGRLLYRSLPPSIVSPAPTLQTVISLRKPSSRVISRYSNAILPRNFNVKITEIDNNNLYGYHFQKLHQNDKIHETTVHAYLKLIQRRSQGTVKSIDFITIHRLKNGHYDHIDRQFRAKDIFAHQWILFPILKNSHFTLIAVQPMHNGLNYIHFCDSLSQDCDIEINAVHSYLQHVASKTNRQALRSWEINKYATINMDRQQDADSCGIYTAMFADCLTTGIPLSVLTNAFIHRCRERLAHCLLNNKVTPLSDENVGVRLRSTDSSAGTQSSVPNDKDKPADSTYTQTAEESKGEEEEFPWSKYNAAYATEDSQDHNSAETWTNHTNNTSDGNVPWPTLPSLSQYHMLQEDYDWTPEVYTKYISNNLIAHESALYMPPISRSDRNQLKYISTSSADNFLLQSLGITHSNFLDLIRPDTLDHSVLTHLFKLGLKPYNTSVNLSI